MRKYRYVLALLLHPSPGIHFWPLTESNGCRDLQRDPLKPSLMFLPRKPPDLSSLASVTLEDRNRRAARLGLTAGVGLEQPELDALWKDAVMTA